MFRPRKVLDGARPRHARHSHARPPRKVAPLHFPNTAKPAWLADGCGFRNDRSTARRAKPRNLQRATGAAALGRRFDERMGAMAMALCRHHMPVSLSSSSCYPSVPLHLFFFPSPPLPGPKYHALQHVTCAIPLRPETCVWTQSLLPSSFATCQGLVSRHPCVPLPQPASVVSLLPSPPGQAAKTRQEKERQIMGMLRLTRDTRQRRGIL